MKKVLKVTCLVLLCSLTMAITVKKPDGSTQIYSTTPGDGMVISGNGNIGLGTLLPSSKLDVSGDAKISGTITAGTFSGNGAALTNVAALTASTANYATSAGSAALATTATNANNSALLNNKDEAALNVSSAQTATTANYATSASSATNATSAGSALTSSTANYAANAGTATYATSAGSALTATTANYAANAALLGNKAEAALNVSSALTATTANYATTAALLGGKAESALSVSTAQKANTLQNTLVTKTSTYTLTSSDSVVLGNAATSAVTLTLPAAAANTGSQFTIKKIDSSKNKVTITITGADTIEGDSSYVLTAQYEYVVVVSNGSSWVIVGNN